jgi:hypothetical protein
MRPFLLPHAGPLAININQPEHPAARVNDQLVRELSSLTSRSLGLAVCQCRLLDRHGGGRGPGGHPCAWLPLGLGQRPGREAEFRPGHAIQASPLQPGSLVRQAWRGTTGVRHTGYCRHG